MIQFRKLLKNILSFFEEPAQEIFIECATEDEIPAAYDDLIELAERLKTPFQKLEKKVNGITMPAIRLQFQDLETAEQYRSKLRESLQDHYHMGVYFESEGKETRVMPELDILVCLILRFRRKSRWE